MSSLYNFSWAIKIFIAFIFGILVLSQTLALVLNYYRYRLRRPRIFESLLEISVLIEVLILGLLYGQMLNAYKNGFIVPSGYGNIRILNFIVILILVIIVSFLNRSILAFSLVPLAAISLPIMETVLGTSYSVFFLVSLILLLVRSIRIFVTSIFEIKTNISSLSITNAVDTLHTGVLFSENDGYTVLINHQMQKIMLATTGIIFRNAIQFYELLISEVDDLRYKKAELDGQMVCIIRDGTAWMFTKTDIQFRMKNYIHISAADVTQQWALTSRLQKQDEELRYKSEKLKTTILNLHILSKEREIENAKMRAHDILGQRLSLLLRTIQNEEYLDYDLLKSLSQGLIEELKSEQIQISPYDEVKNIQKIFDSIGVDIKFNGELPENIEKACLFADIIREGSTNAVRHGFATEINIKAEPIGDNYNLKITNNGHTSVEPITPGSGIGTMRKKVIAQGGNLDIVHYPQFTLSVVLPGGD